MKTPGRLDITLLVVMAHDMTHGYENIAHEFTCLVATYRLKLIDISKALLAFWNYQSGTVLTCA